MTAGPRQPTPNQSKKQRCTDGNQDDPPRMHRADKRRIGIQRNRDQAHLHKASRHQRQQKR